MASAGRLKHNHYTLIVSIFNASYPEQFRSSPPQQHLINNHPSILQKDLHVFKGKMNFRSGHPNLSSHIIQLRKKKVTPQIIGPRIPSSSNPDTNMLELRALILLLLLCPHKDPNQFYNSTTTAIPFYNLWVPSINSDATFLIANAENYHISASLTKLTAERQKDKNRTNPNDLTGEDEPVNIDAATSHPMDTGIATAADESSDDDEYIPPNHDASYNDLLHHSDYPVAEIAKTLTLPFASHLQTFDNLPPNHVATSIPFTTKQITDGYKLKLWTSSTPQSQQLDQTQQIQPHTNPQPNSLTPVARMQLLSSLEVESHTPYTPPPTSSSLSPLPQFPSIQQVSHHWSLNLKQDAVFRKLGQYLLQRILNPTAVIIPPKVIVVGEGGVGKSRIVSALKTLSENYGYPNSVAVMAPSGIAAVNIGGETCDSMCKLLNFNGTFDLQTMTFWESVLLVVLDEFSMCGQSKLSKIESQLRGMKANPAPFGGMGFVLMGDHFQQPPILDKALWIPSQEPHSASPNSTSMSEYNGYNLYRTFTTCFYLTETNRFVDDPELGYHLGNARYGLYSVRLRYLINHQVLSSSHWNLIKTLPSPPVIGTHSNIFRYHIINSFVNQRSTFATLNSNPTYRLMGVLTHKKRTLLDPSLCMKYYRTPASNCDHFHPILDLYVGMPILIMKNISVKIGIANGSHATIQEFVFPSSTTFNIITTTSGGKLSVPNKLPLYILVKVENCNFICNFLTQSSSINTEPGLFPITVQSAPIKNSKPKVRLTQFPISPSFALTDFKLQGSTLHSMILSPFTIDNSIIPNIPSTRTISGPSLYVLLSRVRRLQHLFLMCPVHQKIFTKSQPSMATKAEDDRLIALASTSHTYPPGTPTIKTFSERFQTFQTPFNPTPPLQ